MLFCHAFYLTIVFENTHPKTFFEPMKVAINQQLRAKLINKFFVKKTTYAI
jgi:hypothetical protein